MGWEESLERIANAMEKIAGVSNKPKRHKRSCVEQTEIMFDEQAQRKSFVRSLAGQKSVFVRREKHGTAQPMSQDMKIFIAAYVNAYVRRYDARPDLGGKVQGSIRRLLNDYPVVRAVHLIETYCQMENPWFVTKHHDFETFMGNLNQVIAALTHGKEASTEKSTLEQFEQMGMTK